MVEIGFECSLLDPSATEGRDVLSLASPSAMTSPEVRDAVTAGGWGWVRVGG